MTPFTHPRSKSPVRTAVIGAGISGLIAARTLREHGIEVTVLDKSRSPGGRTATRRADPGLTFDHGAQYFTVRDPQFSTEVKDWEALGLVAEWMGRIVQIEGIDVQPKTGQPRRLVGVPGMSAIARHLATPLPLRLQTRIVAMDRAVDGWHLTDADGQKLGPFDQILVTLPAPQAAELLAPHPFAAAARAVPMTPCWAVLVAFEQRVEVPWDGAFVHGSPLGWVARNSSKPGRNSFADCWVVHATPDWSAGHLELDREQVQERLLAEFATITGMPVPPILHLDAHRWLFSATPLSLDQLALCDPEIGLTVSGDWLAGGRVEGAFRSGLAAAEGLLHRQGLCVTVPPGISNG